MENKVTVKVVDALLLGTTDAENERVIFPYEKGLTFSEMYNLFNYGTKSWSGTELRDCTIIPVEVDSTLYVEITYTWRSGHSWAFESGNKIEMPLEVVTPEWKKEFEDTDPSDFSSRDIEYISSPYYKGEYEGVQYKWKGGEK